MIIYNFWSLKSVREYQLPSSDDESEWVVECRMFWSEDERLFRPRVYRRIEMRMEPSENKYAHKKFDEITLTDEPFLWDAGEKISADSLEQAYEILEAKFSYRLGHRSQSIQEALDKIIEFDANQENLS